MCDALRATNSHKKRPISRVDFFKIKATLKTMAPIFYVISRSVANNDFFEIALFIHSNMNDVYTRRQTRNIN